MIATAVRQRSEKPLVLKQRKINERKKEKQKTGNV